MHTSQIHLNTNQKGLRESRGFQNVILKYTKKRKGENENKWQHSKVKKPMDQEMELDFQT